MAPKQIAPPGHEPEGPVSSCPRTRASRSGAGWQTPARIPAFVGMTVCSSALQPAPPPEWLSARAVDGDMRFPLALRRGPLLRPRLEGLTAARACADRSVRAAHAARAARATCSAAAPGSMPVSTGRSRRPPSCSCTDRRSSAHRDRSTSDRGRSSTGHDSHSRCSSRRTAGSPHRSRIALGHRERTCTGSATSGGRVYTALCRRTAAGHRECTCTCAATNGTRECRGHSRRIVVAGYTPAAYTRHPEGCRYRSSRCSRPPRFGRHWARTGTYLRDSGPHNAAGTAAVADSAYRSYGSRADAPHATCACL